MGRKRRAEQTRFRQRGAAGKRRLLWYLLLFAGVLVLNGTAWASSAFCDWYIAHIFPVWVGSYGRLTGLFPFSVGEWLLGAQLALVAAAVLLGIGTGVLAGVSALRRAIGKRRAGRSGVKLGIGGWNRAGRRGFPEWVRRFYRFLAWEILFACYLMTLNCFLLYHATPFSEKSFTGGKAIGEGQLADLDGADSETAELFALYNRIVSACNELSARMDRDADGRILYGGSEAEGGLTGAALRADRGLMRRMQEEAREAMRALGETFPQLDGYYPRPKPLLTSDFMCQQYMLGYYFPFSLEANYNDVAYAPNLPATMCHELSHLRGYLYEDEANFIGYLACASFEDPFFQYSGYLSVLSYIYRDMVKEMQADEERFRALAERYGLAEVDAQVWEDDTFVLPEEWERINGKALIKTETVKEAADAFIDTNLKVNGVADGKVSYSRVVELLLEYERGGR